MQSNHEGFFVADEIWTFFGDHLPDDEDEPSLDDERPPRRHQPTVKAEGPQSEQEPFLSPEPPTPPSPSAA